MIWCRICNFSYISFFRATRFACSLFARIRLVSLSLYSCLHCLCFCSLKAGISCAAASLSLPIISRPILRLASKAINQIYLIKRFVVANGVCYCLVIFAWTTSDVRFRPTGRSWVWAGGRSPHKCCVRNDSWFCLIIFSVLDYYY